MNGWTGPTCSENIDDCSAASCFNGATCHDKLASFVCECPVGKTGILCQLDDACLSHPCQHGAACETSPIDGTFKCDCPKGFRGSDCSEDIDECIPSNSSISSNYSPHSSSVSGTLSRYRPPAVDGPCEHGGVCVNTLGSFRCHCQPGFTGARCENNINECDSSPCLNDGTCLDERGYFRCVCMPGYAGNRCQKEIDECESNPCVNGAVCVDQINGYSCTCQPGFAGPTCAENIDDCHSSPCKNGGICRDSIDSYTCRCPPGFNGAQCKYQIS